MRVDGKTNTIDVNNIIILDCSASMAYAKYNAAKEGIKKELSLTGELGWRFSFFEMIDKQFSELRVVTKADNEYPENVKLSFTGAIGQSTPLCDTLCLIIEKFINNSTSQKILLKVFTDGQDNASTYENKQRLPELIKKAEKAGFTVVFNCVESDKQYIKKLGVDPSNINSYKNTGEGMVEAFEVTRTATVAYHKNLVLGNDVTTGFYNKQLIKNEE